MSEQYLRKAGLFVSSTERALDLSEAHFSFRTAQQDVESPNNCSIRVYNLAETTIQLIRNEFQRVTLQAGYDGSYGVIFQGQIKQFRIGKESATDSYLDILAADGDEAYNYAYVKKTLAAPNTTPAQQIKAIIEAMNPNGVGQGYTMEMTGGVLPRGKVLFGMANALMRQVVRSQGATWNINNGKVEIIPMNGYKPGEAIVLNSLTGLIGRPEQTIDGVKARCLLNPRLDIGATVKIDNASINRLVQQNPNAPPIPFNQWTGIQNLATIAADGLYRLFVVEHSGDTRGMDWYSDIIGLAINPVTKEVKPYG